MQINKYSSFLVAGIFSLALIVYILVNRDFVNVINQNTSIVQQLSKELAENNRIRILNIDTNHDRVIENLDKLSKSVTETLETNSRIIAENTKRIEKIERKINGKRDEERQ